MAATTDTKIWMAIRGAVTAAAGGLPIAWRDEVFTPPKTATGLLPFLAVGDVQNVTRPLIGSNAVREYTGIVTLSYVAPLGYDAAWYIQNASALLNGFLLDRSYSFQGVCVKWGNPPSVPRIDRGYRDDGYIRTPIIIPWRCVTR